MKLYNEMKSISIIE